MNLPKKSLGQNFLIDKNILNKITDQVDIKDQTVIEIGPGTGNLTYEIIKKKPKYLILIEKDKNLYLELKKKLQTYKKVQIFNEDVLKFNFDKYIKKNTIIFGNLPFNISSQILVKLIKNSLNTKKIKYLVLMFQKELAEKIIAKFKTKNYGRLSILTAYALDIFNRFNISRNCFYPKPKVESTLIVFKPKKNINIKINNIENLEKITNVFFTQKRKMINKPLKKIFPNFSKVADNLDLKLSIRPSEISNEKYLKIVQKYEKL